MSLLPFFQWCESLALSVAIRDSLWLFPVIEAVHLLGLALIGGIVLLVDLRLFGFSVTAKPLPALSREIEPWLIGSLGVMMMTGLLLYTSEPIKLYYNTPFWLKMAFLALAIGYTFTIRRRVLAAGEARIAPAWRKLVAIISISLWTGVGISGRGIGFY
jgi:hypothetical protein